MGLSVERLTKLVGAIENDKLVFLCGAGLSVPSPSLLPTAPVVAKKCYDKRMPVEALPSALEWDLDRLAGFFHARGDFVETFIPLVPWNDLSGDPNAGHATVGDLLICRAAHGALSANFDTMIERWAAQRKVDLQGALTGQQAIDLAHVSNPLIKFHGCMTLGKVETLWTQAQLAEPAVQAKIKSCSEWMTQNLPGRHMFVVGFWTDWGYLNDVLAEAFTIANAASVTVIDLADTAALTAKAPDLWQKLTALSGDFEHVKASSDEALAQLREAFSRTWARKFYALGQTAAAARGVAATPSPDTLSVDALYDLRRDVEGIPYTRAASLKAPPVACGEASLAHLTVLGTGGTQQGAWLEHSTKSIRVVNGVGRPLEEVKEAHKEPTALQQPNIVICAGALDTGVPAKLIATGKGASVVSPAPGGAAQWMTLADARAALGLP